MCCYFIIVRIIRALMSKFAIDYFEQRNNHGNLLKKCLIKLVRSILGLSRKKHTGAKATSGCSVVAQNN